MLKHEEAMYQRILGFWLGETSAKLLRLSYKGLMKESCPFVVVIMELDAFVNNWMLSQDTFV